MTGMSVDVRNTLQNLDVGSGLAEGNRDDLEQMIADMTGERLDFWERGEDQVLQEGRDGFGSVYGMGSGEEMTHLGSLDLDLAFFPNGEAEMGSGLT